jgi:hypothetical protein
MPNSRLVWNDIERKPCEYSLDPSLKMSSAIDNLFLRSKLALEWIIDSLARTDANQSAETGADRRQIKDDHEPTERRERCPKCRLPKLVLVDCLECGAKRFECHRCGWETPDCHYSVVSLEKCTIAA